MAFGVDVGGVDEVDAGFEGSLDKLIGSILIDGADILPEALAVEGHGAEAKG
jgi:hypothetical protein